MQRKSTLVRRPSSERFLSADFAENDDVADQVQALSSSASLTSQPVEAVTLLVKGRPLSTVIQVLADALLQQQAHTRRGREAAEAQAKQAAAQLADHRDTLSRIQEDLHLAQRPFSLHGEASAASGEGRAVRRPRQPASTDTFGEAVQLLYQRTQQLRVVIFASSAQASAEKLRREQLSKWFALWVPCGVRRVAATEMARTSRLQTLSTYYARWRRRTEQDQRQRALARARHLRAVSRRSQNTILLVYLRKWAGFVSGLATQATQLSAYQRRVAHQLSISGPAVAALRRTYFGLWRQWSSLCGEERRVTAARHAAQEGVRGQHHEQHLMKGALARWQKATQQRQISRLYQRLSRVLSAQTCQSLLRRHFHSWMACSVRARQVQRLEVLAADQHKRRVTALARRYFNELRFFRREQQFQRMMRSMEGSLLLLADRVNDVEDAVLTHRGPPAVAAGGGRLFVSPPRPAAPSREGRPTTMHVQWSPGSNDELFARVESILGRSR